MKKEEQEKRKKSGIIGIVVFICLLVILAIFIIMMAMPKKHTITFSGVVGYQNIKVQDGKTLTKPADPYKEGYTFVGWYYENKLFDFTEKITKDIRLEAKFLKEEKQKQYTVTFDSDGGTVLKSVSVNENSKLSMPTNPAKEGYRFVEWQYEGKTFDFKTDITKNITLKAIWEKVEDTTNVNKYTVNFNSNGGTKVNSQTVASGEVVKKPSNPTRSGYTFVAWKLNGKNYNFATKVAKNITLVAEWKKVNSGSNSGNNTTTPEPTPQPTPDEKPVVKPEPTPDEGNQPVSKITVTFKSDNSIFNTQMVEKGSHVNNPGNPTKDGYRFVEWQLNGKTYSFNQAVNENITLVAKWEAVYTYTVHDYALSDLQKEIRVWHGSQDITSSVTAVYKNGVLIGRNVSGIIVNKNEIDSINSASYKGNKITLTRK